METPPTVADYAPLAPSLTAWEAKERAGLLALETEEWREKRLIAENPNTTADVLERFAAEALEARKQALHTARKSDNAAKNRGETPPSSRRREIWRRGDLLLEALAAHPNTPPRALAELVGTTPFITRAFCHNPITPFLLLEEPSFLADLGSIKQQYLLCHAGAPLFYIRMLAMEDNTGNHWTRKAAQMHVAFAGQVNTVAEWRRQVCDFWRDECAFAEDPTLRHWYADFVEMGLVPSWANGAGSPAAGLVPFYLVESLDEWFHYRHTPGSAEEDALLKRFCLCDQDKDVMARGLRAEATPDDMCALLDTLRCRLSAHPAVLRHPLVQQGYSDDTQVGQQNLSDVLMRLVQSPYPDVRRVARRHPNAPANAADISRRAFIQHVEKRGSAPPELGVFIASLHGAYQQKDLPDKSNSGHWTHRLEASLLASARDNCPLEDPYGRTALDLMHHLAVRDGNRLVRWAARTRLADPDFVFTWHEESGSK